MDQAHMVSICHNLLLCITGLCEVTNEKNEAQFVHMARDTAHSTVALGVFPLHYVLTYRGCSGTVP
jgi:hypothetical protein